MRGISLDEIATATKISTRNLRALEEEKFNQLPGGIFNKGFVRAYAKFLGIDEEQMVAEYSSASADTEAARDQKLKTDLSRVEFKRDDEEQREISLEPKSQWGTIAIIVLIAVAVFGGWEVYQKKKAERQQQAQLPPPVVTSPAPTPVQTPVQPTDPSAIATAPSTQGQPSAGSTTQATSPSTTPSDLSKPATQKSPNETPGSTLTPAAGSTGAPAKSSTPDSKSSPPESKSTTPEKKPDTQVIGSGPIDVKIHANQDSWVSITADGKTIMKGTLAAASERAVRAKDQVVVVLGNAGGVEVSYNGKTLDNLGKGQEVKKLTFTPTGYE